MPVPPPSMTSYRPVIRGDNGVAMASHPAAALAGLDILRQGGNAIDAGVAVGLALNVVHFIECGFLGVAPTIIYLADRGEVTTIDGLGVWPKAATLEYFQEHHPNGVPWEAVAALTPAAADAWFTALSRFGTMTFSQVVAPAIKLAEGGFPAYRYLVYRMQSQHQGYRRWPTTAEIYLRNGRVPRVGEMLYLRDMAITLRHLASIEEAHRGRGREAALEIARDFIYKGEMAQAIVSLCQSQGGFLTMEDLAEYRVRIEPPVRVDYRGYQVYTCGPWSQGPVLPQALKMLEGYDLQAMGHNSSSYVHTITQALNLAFADREQYVGDPAFVDVPIEEMLSDAYLGRRRSLIDPDRAWPAMPPPGDPRSGMATMPGAAQSPAEALAQPTNAESSGTSYFAVIDRQGNIFSSTPSEGNNNGGAVIPGTGLVMSMRGYQSKVETGHPASIAPGKRPRLTPMPGLVLRDGRPVMAFGGHGGDHIPQGMLQLLLNVVEFGMDSQQAVEAARFYSYSFPSSGLPVFYDPGTVRLEGRIPEDVVGDLRRRSHIAEMYPDWWEGSGLYGMIIRDPATGAMEGGADPRGEAYAVGY